MTTTTNQRRVRHRRWTITDEAGKPLAEVTGSSGGISHLEAVRRFGGDWEVVEVSWTQAWVRVRPSG